MKNNNNHHLSELPLRISICCLLFLLSDGKSGSLITTVRTADAMLNELHPGEYREFVAYRYLITVDCWSMDFDSGLHTVAAGDSWSFTILNSSNLQLQS
jgi:hypothetical protein